VEVDDHKFIYNKGSFDFGPYIMHSPIAVC